MALKKESGRPPLGEPEAVRAGKSRPCSGAASGRAPGGLPERAGWELRSPGGFGRFGKKAEREIRLFLLWIQRCGAGAQDRPAQSVGRSSPRMSKGPTWSPTCVHFQLGLVPFNPGPWPPSPHFTGVSNLALISGPGC